MIPNSKKQRKKCSRDQTKGADRVRDILCLAYMPDENASARQRLYNYTTYIDKKRIRLHIYPPVSSSLYRGLYLKGKIYRHYVFFVLLFFRRFFVLWSAPRFDGVFLQREIMSEFFYDPPLFIFVLKLLNPNIVYDIDDAIWLLPPHSSMAGNRLLSKLANMRFKWNVRLSKTIIVSTPYIADHARKLNPSVVVIPTLVETDKYFQKVHRPIKPLVIGWIGGGGNVKYLQQVASPLSAIASTYDIILRVISSRSIHIKGVPTEFRKWSKNTANQDLKAFDIGIMPLSDNAYTRGKGGFKLLEYMASGIPSVASPVGVNCNLIKNKENGFLANNSDQWQKALICLIKDSTLRQKIGMNGYDFVRKKFDYTVWASFFTKTIFKALG